MIRFHLITALLRFKIFPVLVSQRMETKTEIITSIDMWWCRQCSYRLFNREIRDNPIYQFEGSSYPTIGLELSNSTTEKWYRRSQIIFSYSN
jgi:hypothetical protein